jgi:hypothetical protein
MLFVCVLLGGFALAFAEVAKQTKSFQPESPCSDGTATCMADRR